MWQLAIFYSPAATNFIQDANSDEDNMATSNQLGREGAGATTPSPHNDDDAFDMRLKRHVLQEDGSEMSSKTHGLKGDGLVNDQASVAIDYLPKFMFYTGNEVLTPACETLDFEDAFEHHMLKPMTFQEAYNHEDPEQHAKWHATIGKCSRT